MPSSPIIPRRDLVFSLIRWWSALLAGWIGLGAAGPVRAFQIETGLPGMIEAGTPEFSVLATETIGLDSAPTDVRLLPDGRILLVAGVQLAMGDGVRWQVYRQPATAAPVEVRGAVVDPLTGRIYVSTAVGGAEAVFGEDGTWRPVSAVQWTVPGAASPIIMPQSTVEVSGNEWFWHSLTGAVFTWRPEQPIRLTGYANTFECVFKLDGKIYLSERGNGTLSRLEAGRDPVTVKAEGVLSAFTCAQPFEPGQVLVGTYGQGLQLFDGLVSTRFPAAGELAGGARINALCSTEGGYFAAAVDNQGVYFFGRNGRTVQVLDRTLDQRLTRVKSLLPAPGGIVWGLLDSGLLRIKFPARISHFESLISPGLTTVHPFRYEGRLWWLADGKIYRGVYNQEDRLERLAIDTPADNFANSFSVAPGYPVCGTEHGAFQRTEAGWVPFAADTKHLRILDDEPVNGRWLYTALNEVGWLRRDGGSVVVSERFPAPGLGNIFNRPVKDAAGRYWLELGIGRLGRVELRDGVPVPKIFTTEDGLLHNWPQAFLIDGQIRLNLSEQLFHFDESGGRFVPDTTLIASIPGVKKIFGRMGEDTLGRLWLSGDGALQVFARKDGQWSERVMTVPLGFQPYYLTFERGGVVWLHFQHRLARYDPGLPEPAATELRALLTQVNLAGSKRSLFGLDRELPALDFADNSLIAYFVATGNAFAPGVTFDVRLEGSGSEWVSAGSAGSAAFNHLKEGRYVLHVRPRSGETVGAEDTLAFSVLPPWYRTPFAYAAYACSALLAVLMTVWLSTLLERRENARLERLVAERTGELSLSNLQLASQMDEIRVLTQAIAQSPIAVFITTPEGTIEYSNPRAGELTGHTAEQLTGSTIGRLRASAVTSAVVQEIATALARGESWSGQLANQHGEGRIVQVRSTISPILGQDGGVRHHLILEEDVTEWLGEQQRRRRLEAQLFQAQKMESIGTLAGGIAHDFNNILTGILGYCELARLAVDDNTDVRPELQQIRAAGLRAKDLVMQILTFSRKNNANQVVIDIFRPVEEAMKLIRASTPATIQIVQKLEPGNVKADSSQIHQVIVNLCTNAIHAMQDGPGRLEVTLARTLVDARLAAETPNLKAGATMRLTVTDTGHGMDQATLERIFDPFFTTKTQGKGTGLGLSIVQGVVVSHGGAMQVASQPGVGTTFDLYFPLALEPLAKPTPTTSPIPGAGQDILLVDDEPAVSEFALARLKHYGYRPIHFNDPRQALAAFLAEPLRFAALVTDLTMPHMTGLDLIQQVRQLRTQVPVVVLTGYGRESTREKLAQLSHCLFLQKPFSGEDLAHAVGQVLQHGQSAAKSGPAGKASQSNM